jgi:hypothetical protein
VSGLVPALQATGRLARLGAGALAGRTSLRLGATWTTLVIAQVAFSVGVLPLAAELAWGTLRTASSARASPPRSLRPRASRWKRPVRARCERSPTAQWPASRRTRGDNAPCSLAIASASWRDGCWPTRASRRGGRLAAARRGALGVRRHRGPRRADRGHSTAGCRVPARFNQVDTAFFDIYQVPGLSGRRFNERDVAAETDAVIVNRNFADTIAPGGNALGQPFPLRPCDGRRVR